MAGRRILAALLIPGTLLVILLAAWGVDAGLNAGTVRRNVVIAPPIVEALDVGGLSEAELGDKLSELADDFAAVPVELTGGDQTVVVTAGQLGMNLDVAQTAPEILALGQGNAVLRPFRWLGEVFGETTVTPDVVVDQQVDYGAVADLFSSGLDEPQEPTLRLTNGQFVVEPGSPSVRYDTAGVQDATLAAIARGDNPISVEIPRVEIPPNVSQSQAQAWADDLNTRTAAGLVLTVEGESRTLQGDVLRAWFEVDTSGGQLDWTLNQTLLTTGLTELFAGSTLGPPPQITVVDGVPTVIGGSAGRACCAENAGELITDALKADRTFLILDATTGSGNQGQRELEQLGIVEEISTFTTFHACCEGRVTNIQRMAELVRGTVIEPGEVFSLNGHVGQRTVEKGFVEGGVIYFGEFQADVGGGVSQFATTLFNAAFYGGLEFPVYQAHTIYISRYPYGIEATVSWPAPDLQIENTTDYGILIWPTWTGDSITVTLYSTKHMDATVTAQWNTPDGQCTVVTTQRERAYYSGTTTVDQISAWYQPGDGIGCDGQPTNPEKRQEPVATPTPAPEPTTPPEPTMPPEPTVPPEPTSPPTTSPEPTAVPEPTVAPEPTAEPEPTTGVEPTTPPEATVAPTAVPEPTPVPEPTTPNGDDADTDGGL